MPDPIRILPKHTLRDPGADPHLNEEWLVTNGLGGYASGTVDGAISRRYHGLLISGLPTPVGRMVMLNAISERLRVPDRQVVFVGPESLTGAPSDATLPVSEFRLEAGLPVWRYESDHFVFEKRLLMPYRQNTVHITYKFGGKGALRLGLRPAVHFRHHDSPVNNDENLQYVLTVCGDRYEIAAGPNYPVLRMKIHGESAAFTFDPKLTRGVLYQTEKNRGYESQGSLWSPG